MATNAGSVLVHVGADLSNFNSGMARAHGTIGGFGGIAKKAMLGVGAAFAAGGIMSLKAAGNFEQSLNTFQAVSAATAFDMKAVSKVARTLGRDITLPAVSAKDAAEAMTELAKGGLSVKQSMAAAKGVLQLAAAAQISNAEAATITARALNAFKLKGNQAAKVADVLANAANASTGEITDFALGLQQSSAVAKQWGLSINETTAALMQLADAGVVGSDAGTSLKTMLQSLSATTEPARKTMREMGVDVFDANGKFVGMKDTIGQFSAALAGMSQEQQTAALKTIFGSDAVRAANVILGEGAKAYQTYVDKTERQGAASDLAAAKMKGFTGSLEAFKSTLETLSIELGTKLLPAATSAMRAFTSLVTTAGSAGSFFKNELVTGVGAGVLALTSVMFAASGVAKAVALVRSAMLALTVANPVLLGLAVTVGLLTMAIVSLRNSGNSGAQAIDTLKAALDRLKPSADSAAGAALDLAEAKNRAKTAALNVTSAVKAQQAVLASGGKASFEYKVATNAVEAAQLALKRAHIDVQAQTTKTASLQANATRVQDTAKNSVALLQRSLEGITKAGHDYQSSGARATIVTKELSSQLEKQMARRFAGELHDLSVKASTTAKKLDETNPALARIALGVAKAAEAKAKLALELGKIPSAVDSVKDPGIRAALGVGRGISGGVVAGAAGMGSRLAWQMNAEIFSAIALVKQTHGIRSPAKTTEQQIGIPLGQGIVSGMDGGLALLAPRMQARIKAAVDRAAAVVAAARTRFTASFSLLSDRLLRAFDATTGGHATPAEAQIAAIGERRQSEDLQRALKEARASGDAQAIARAQEDIQLAALEKTARVERMAWEDRRAEMRSQMESRLQQLEGSFVKEGATVDSALTRIGKLMRSYGITYAQAGGEIGEMFVSGLIGEIARAANAAAGVRGGLTGGDPTVSTATRARAAGLQPAVSVTVQGSLIHEREIEQVVVDAVRSYSRTNGPLGSRTAGFAI